MREDAFKIAEGSSGTKARWAVIACCMGAYFFDSYDMYILGIAMQNILADLHMTTVEGGLLSSATMLGAVIGCLFLGRFASNWGNKLCLVACTAWIGLGSLAVVFVTSFPAWFVLRVLTGMGIGGIMGPIHALIWQHWGPAYRAKITGLTFSTFPIAGIAASFAGKLVLSVDFRWIFVTAALSILVAVAAQLLIPDDRHLVPAGQQKGTKAAEKVRLSEIFTGRYKWITLFAILASFANMAACWAMNTWIPSWLMIDRGLDVSQMTSFAMLNYFGGLVGYLTWGFIGAKMGSGRAMVFAYALSTAALLAYVVMPGGDYLLLLGPLLYFGQGGCACLNSILFAEIYPERLRAYGSGTAFNVGRVGSIVSPYTVALVGTSFGLTAGLLMAPAFFAFGAVVSVVLNRMLRGGESNEKEEDHGND